MTRQFLSPVGAAVGLLCAATVSASEAPTERAWLILQEGLASKRAARRTNAVHALRILVHNTRAQDLVEQSLADPDLRVRAATARAPGLMEAVSSQSSLERLLNDKEPFVVLAAAALMLVAVVAFLIRGSLSRVPRGWLRLAVGLLLSAFGTFWAGEGALVQWPGGDLAIIGLLALMTAAAFSYLTLLRYEAT